MKNEEIVQIPLEQLTTTAIKIREIHKNHDRLETILRTAKEKGIIVPIIVRPYKENGAVIPNRWEIIEGGHRVFAANQLGFKTIKAEIRDVDDDEARSIQFFCNRGHVPNTATEELNFIKVIMSHHPDWNYTQLGKETGLSPVEISKLLKLKNLDETVMQALDKGDIAASRAFSLSGLPQEFQIQLLPCCKKAHNEYLPLEAFDQRVVDMKKAAKTGVKPKSEGPQYSRRAMPEYVEKMVELQEKKEQDPKNEIWAFLCQLMEWVLRIDPDSLVEKKAKKDAKDLPRLQKKYEDQEAKLTAALKEIEEAKKELQKKQNVEGI